jgi:hypothetical protein
MIRNIGSPDPYIKRDALPGWKSWGIQVIALLLSWCFADHHLFHRQTEPAESL